MTTSPASTQPGIDPATLAPDTRVEVEGLNIRDNLTLGYIGKRGGFVHWQLGAEQSWDEWRIVRVLADATPWPMISPSDVCEGMLIERREGENAVRGRVSTIAPTALSIFAQNNAVILWSEDIERFEGWTLHVHPDDAPTADPDADLIEAMALAAFAAGNKCLAWESTTDGAREAYLIEARAALAVVRAHDAKAGA